MIVSDLIFILLLFLFCSLPVWNISPQHRVKKRALHHNMVAEAPSVSYYWCNRPPGRMWFLCVRVWMCAFADCIAIFPRASWVCIWYPVTSGWWKVSSRIDGHNGHSSTDTQIQVWGFLLAALQLRVKLNIHLEAKMGTQNTIIWAWIRPLWVLMSPSHWSIAFLTIKELFFMLWILNSVTKT